jgi:hypothetical protein
MDLGHRAAIETTLGRVKWPRRSLAGSKGEKDDRTGTLGRLHLADKATIAAEDGHGDRYSPTPEVGEEFSLIEGVVHGAPAVPV